MPLSTKAIWLARGGVVLVLLLQSCAKNNLPDYNRLGNLRILTIQADHPEASPGDTVVLTPVISDISGAGRTLSWAAESCVDPGIGYGAEPSCEKATDRVELGSGSYAPVGPAFTESVTPVSVTLPTTLFSNRSLQDQYNGVSYLIIYSVSAADNSKVTSIKRVLVSSRNTKNSNPVISDLLSAGTTMSALPAAKTDLSVQIAPGSAEVFTVLLGNGAQENQTETLLTTWFSSDGSFSRYRVFGDSVDSYEPSSTPPIGHATVIVAVTRDGRGGEAYRIVSFP